MIRRGLVTVLKDDARALEMGELLFEALCTQLSEEIQRATARPGGRWRQWTAGELNTRVFSWISTTGLVEWTYSWQTTVTPLSFS